MSITKIGNAITVSWQETATIRIGHHSCAWCGILTPEPTSDVLAGFAKHCGINVAERRVLWPFDGVVDYVWAPPGWTHPPGELFCPDCSTERAKALEQAICRVASRLLPGDR